MSLRMLRRENGLTLEALADRTGLTKSYLSKVERGHSTPSIAVAIKLASALHVEVGSLFGEQDEAALIKVDRAGERTALSPTASAEGSGYDGLALGMTGKQMLPFVIYPSSEGSRCVFRNHDGDEFVVVHAGRVELTFPDRTVTLEPGDTAYFKGGIPHHFRSLGETEAVLYIVISDSGNQ